MNLPNCLTMLRIVLAVLLLPAAFAPGIGFKALALVIFLAASFTDYWDGRIARERGLITDFGILMDPLADKMLVLAAFISFSQMGLIPAWMVLAVIARDLLITGLRLTMRPGKAQSARSSGKNKTAFQFLAIFGILVYLIIRETPDWNPAWEPIAHRAIYGVMLAVVAMTLWSGVRYAMAQNWSAGGESK
jgi:CDP-diacylglycerol--glycerol-3-phosphate 3-phosphatidyltransferase